MLRTTADEQGRELLDVARLYHSDDPLSRKAPLKDRDTTRRVIDALLGRRGKDGSGSPVSLSSPNSSSSSEPIGAVPTTTLSSGGTGTLGEESDAVLMRPPLANVHGYGPLLLSDVPPSCLADARPSGLSPSVVVGIDEAGRGSVLGPMVYGCAYWSTDLQDAVPAGFNDSKQLSEEQRARLFDAILDAPAVGFGTRVLYASEISRHMLRSQPYNLNQMSHDAAMDLIRSLRHAGVAIRTCYVDTVGNPAHYRRLLEREFEDIEFVVESKADSKYAPCSAASVVAKVLRDALLANWEFSEPRRGRSGSRLFGSGYPSDPTCQAWLQQNKDPVFGYCDLVRFSWAPIKKVLQGNNANGSAKGSGSSLTDPSNVARVEFAADHDDDTWEPRAGKGNTSAIAMKRQRDQLHHFLQNKRKPFPYFQRCKLEHIAKIQK